MFVKKWLYGTLIPQQGQVTPLKQISTIPVYAFIRACSANKRLYRDLRSKEETFSEGWH